MSSINITPQADNLEPISVYSSHYRDQLFREAERLYKRKAGGTLHIDRNMLTVEEGLKSADYFMETIARVGTNHVHVSYFVNPERTLERNAWGLAQIIFKKIKGQRTL